MVSKFKKKPVIIEAVQLKGDHQSVYEVYSFIHGKPDNSSCKMADDYWEMYSEKVLKEGMRLKTLESGNETQIASIGDWIIKGINGEFYPCKHDIFLKTYEEVE